MGDRLGQLWACGEHRLIVGDCTDKAVVERLMQGQQAVLCHADPPYGMGKEAEGIANDNLYASKLDAFQMRWWQACRASLAATRACISGVMRKTCGACGIRGAPGQ